MFYFHFNLNISEIIFLLLVLCPSKNHLRNKKYNILVLTNYFLIISAQSTKSKSKEKDKDKMKDKGKVGETEVPSSIITSSL